MNRTPPALLALGLLCSSAVGGPWQQCLQLRDDARRLACYDEYARHLTRSQTEGGDPAAFGLPPRPPAEELNAVSARIQALEPLGHGRRLIVLDNGQRWRQLESRSHPRLKVGDRITIRRASLGSFLLSRQGSGGSLRVKRLP